MYTETIAQKAVRLLSPIPESEWITGSFTNGRNACCMLGHFGRLTGSTPNDYRQTMGDRVELARRVSDFLEMRHGLRTSAIAVNDSDRVNGYNEPIIKHRVIHLLNDMVEAGY